MALKLIAVDGMTIQVDDPTVSATISITGTPSSKVKAGGHGVYREGTSISVTAITVPSAGATIPDPGPYIDSFIADAEKAKAEMGLVLRVDDTTGTIMATPQIPGTPPTPYPVSFKVEIVDAGQTKSKAQ